MAFCRAIRGLDSSHPGKISRNSNIRTSWRVESTYILSPGETNSKEAQRAVDSGADILVAQGSDSGGHGASDSASIISLVPELVSAFPQIPVLAAGGIVEASGILAALALGAEGVVMGTRFATTLESAMAENAKALILQTTDGGATTKRLSEHDKELTLGLEYLMSCVERGIG